MRVKTDLRRRAIVEAAWQVFKAEGYERASMSGIAAMLGGSKATLYGYFPSKEALFVAAVTDAVKLRTSPVFDPLTSSSDLRGTLMQFAEAYLRLRTSPEMMAVERLLIAEAAREQLGGAIRTHVVETEFGRLAGLIGEAMRDGRLRKADPTRAALQLKALVEGDLHERLLHGVIAEASNEEIRIEAHEGVEAFLRAYAAG